MLKLFEVFTNNISVIHKGIQKLKSDEMQKFGLKGNHLMYLFYLLRHEEGLTAGQLAELVGVNKAAVSRALAELFDCGVISYPDYAGGKKYNTVAVLTKEGKDKAEKIEKRILELIEQMSLSNVEEDDRTTTYIFLRTLAGNITNFIEEKPLT